MSKPAPCNNCGYPDTAKAHLCKHRPTPFDQKLDEILRELFNRSGVKLTEIGWKLADEELQTAKQQIKDALREAVGEDEPEPSYEALSAGVSAGAGYRNQEKQRIRKELGL